MKATYLILPAAALVCVGAWNFSQMRSVAVLNKDNTELRGKILTASSTASSQPVGSSNKLGKAISSKRNQAIDWQQLSDSMVKMENGGISEMSAALDLEKRLLEMTRDEMVAALDEIDAMKLSDAGRQALEEAILESLIDKDPEYSLERFGSRIKSDPDGIGSQLAAAMHAWAKKDPAAATAWFNARIADGDFESKTLDGNSEVRGEFEAALLDQLLGTDYAAAAARLAALPPDQRRDILEQIAFDGLDPNAQQAYASLIRQQIPSDERAGSFAHIASELVDEQGYGKVDAFLDAARATPEERLAAARETAKSQVESLNNMGDLNRKSVDSMREWLARQAPDQVDRITGRALAEAAQGRGKFKFDEASKWVLDYHKASANDDVLVAFIKSYSNRSNLDKAKDLIPRIRDPIVRAQIGNRNP